jgi:hypothetical protein
VKTAAQFKPSHSCAILLVGDPKTGKTNAMFAFPGLYVLDCDMNMASAVRRYPGVSFKFDQLAIDDNDKEVPIELRWTRATSCLKAALLDPEIRTIAIDGLGVLTETLIAHIVAANIKAGTCKTGKMELQMYGDLARMLKDLVMWLRATGKIIVVTSHQTSDKDETTGVMRYYLSIPGSSKETLGGLFTDVWATTARPSGISDHKYSIMTKPTGLHVALGTSFDLAASIDITNKKPNEIWAMLGPKLGL